MSPSKWALVTGVSPGGMGEGHVNALKRGINVVLTTIDLGLLENLRLVDGKYGAYTVRLELDVASAESIANAVERVHTITAGRLDFLMNNAGYGYYMPLLDVDIEKAKKQYDVNVYGILAVTQAFFPLLRIAKGTVVNQGSVSGVQGFNRPYMGIYSSSKAAVHSLSDCMRVEFAPFGVKVVTLVTGSVKTEFFNNKEGGRTVTIPSSSVYLPIRDHVETMMRGSLAGSGATDRSIATSNTIAALLRSSWLRTRYIRQGYAAFKLWLMHLLLPVWLMDRWSRQSGGLDKLKRMLKS